MPYSDPDKQKSYQRDWVRHKRKGSTKPVIPVEPDVEPSDTLVQPSPLRAVEDFTTADSLPIEPKPQSYCSFMVGYVPPED